MLRRGQINAEIALSEKSALLLHRHVDVPCSLVVAYLYINLTLDGKLCLRDDKNAVSFNIMAGEPGKRHDVRAH